MPGGERDEPGCEGGGGRRPEAEVDSPCLDSKTLVSLVWYAPGVIWVDAKQVFWPVSLAIFRT